MFGKSTFQWLSDVSMIICGLDYSMIYSQKKFHGNVLYKNSIMYSIDTIQKKHFHGIFVDMIWIKKFHGNVFLNRHHVDHEYAYYKKHFHGNFQRHNINKNDTYKND